MNSKDDKTLQEDNADDDRGTGRIAVDSDAIRELAALLNETGLTEIELKHGEQRLRVARHAAPPALYSSGPPVPVMSEPVGGARPAADQAPKRATGTTITSPMVGTVYVAPEPGKPPFVKVGDQVKEGDTLLIVEAMKTMNPISAPRAGTVAEICIGDTEPVEFGQTLIVLS
ncbi:MAG TPA: acetyl-CoA carboxylase biotin carboxyl carrier protein [Rhizomicrobium sp.]|jgi:acetyl-CoA carboxylase biotin carboxyl carrier protein